MGAWGVGSFENDNAVDWTYGLEGKSDLSFIETTLDKVLNWGASYLEAPDAEEAIAAAEAVARLLGRFGVRDAYTTSIDNWVSQVRSCHHPNSQKRHGGLWSVFSNSQLNCSSFGKRARKPKHGRTL